MPSRPVPQDSLEESTEKSQKQELDASDSMLSGETLLKQSGESFGLSGEHLAPLPEGRYVVDESAPGALLGKGGQAKVWRARDTVLRREVALKKLHPQAQGDPATVSAFLREARVTALLEHPGIVPIHDVGRDPLDGAISIALGLVTGKSLAASLDAAATLDERLRLVPALVRACQTLAFAHERGVVHRDLKPQNIMLGGFGETFVVDWGLALIESRVGAPDITAPHQVTGVVGTPAYMSPEQAMGLMCDARSDVFGLGACLYHLLTGDPPISGSSLDSAMSHAVKAEVKAVRDLEPNVPEDLAAICQKAIALERSARYRNAGELAKDLEAWLAGRTVSARAYSRGELITRALAANRRVVMLVGLALVVLGGVLAFDEYRVREERNEARTFVRGLIADLPKQIEAARGNVELINTLTQRTQQWLARTDLSREEAAEACGVLEFLGTVNADTGSWPRAIELSEQALRLARQGRERYPKDPVFVAREVEALGNIGYAQIEFGNDEKGFVALREAYATWDAWKGERTEDLLTVRAALAVKQGNILWTRDPAAGRKSFIEAAELVAPVLANGAPAEKLDAAQRSINAVSALWAEGRIADAYALSGRLAEAAQDDCQRQTLAGQRTCVLLLGPQATLAPWLDDPKAPEMARLALAADDFVSERDVDSSASLYDSMTLHIELGQFQVAADRARRLRLNGSADWGKDMGPLAAILAADAAEFNEWKPLLAEAQTGGRIALALHAASERRYAEAAALLRRVDRVRLWNGIAWPAHPKPALALSADAQPAFERFLKDFSAAYGKASEKEMSAALDQFADALQALP